MQQPPRLVTLRALKRRGIRREAYFELIKTLGPYFASRGLATRLALGDTSDATPIGFIKPALRDPEALRYVGAVDFHSWRGCTDEILAQWRDAARELREAGEPPRRVIALWNAGLAWCPAPVSA